MLYDVLAIGAIAVIALDTVDVFDFSPDLERYFRGAAAVLVAVFFSDKLDTFRDRNRRNRRR